MVASVVVWVCTVRHLSFYRDIYVIERFQSVYKRSTNPKASGFNWVNKVIILSNLDSSACTRTPPLSLHLEGLRDGSVSTATVLYWLHWCCFKKKISQVSRRVHRVPAAQKEHSEKVQMFSNMLDTISPCYALLAVWESEVPLWSGYSCTSQTGASFFQTGATGFYLGPLLSPKLSVTFQCSADKLQIYLPFNTNGPVSFYVLLEAICCTQPWVNINFISLI